MKIVTIIGARPQFIKAAQVRKILQERDHHEILVHTGQHYDYLMSKVFFDELLISEPDYNLEVGSASPAKQMGAMMVKLEEVLALEKPDFAIVYGDTNSTLAAALTAVKGNFPVVHVEGGERNFSADMQVVHPCSIPEETNRVITDHVSKAIFCASQRAVENLKHEGITQNVFFSGDIMLESFLQMSNIAQQRSGILGTLKIKPGEFVLTTIHRAINTDDPHRLKSILIALLSLNETVVFPVHPRTRKLINSLGMNDEINRTKSLSLIEPVGYFDMLELERNSRLIITDSGGVTREAFFCNVPAIIVDETTAWIDLVLAGWSTLTGSGTNKIIQAVQSAQRPLKKEPLLGDGNTSEFIVRRLEELFPGIDANI